MKTSLILFNLIFTALLTTRITFAQVAINADGADPDASAVLDLQSITQGFLVPRLTEAQKNGISEPAQGLLIYQTDGDAGFYYNRGTPSLPDWLSLSSSTTSVLWIKSPTNTSTILANPADSVAIGKTMPLEKLDVRGNIDIDNFFPMPNPGRRGEISG